MELGLAELKNEISSSQFVELAIVSKYRQKY